VIFYLPPGRIRQRSAERLQPCPSRLTAFEHPVHLPLLLAVADALALVELAFALGQGKRDLGLAGFEVELQRHQRVSLLVRFGVQARDLPFVQEELSHPQGLMVVVVGKGVGADVHLVEPDFAVLDLGVGVFQVGFPQPQGLNLGAGQHEPGLVLVDDEVIVPRLAVLGDDLDGAFFHGSGP
jgi:hypothetical protein